MERNNPFTPSFGKIPPFMAGRTELVEDMLRAFEGGIGDPNLSSILVGSRGTGKTALLFYLSAEASSRGWVCANVAAVPGMLEDVIERAKEASAHLRASEGGARLTGISVGQAIGLEWEREPAAQGNWRTRMNRLLDELNEQDIGLLITVDEVRVELGEMVQLASTYQHFVGENRKVALLMAGLPGKVSSLLRDDSISFLRRACRFTLGRIADSEIEDALRKTVEDGGRRIGVAALTKAVEAIGGFPYMMQLVGFRMWGQHPENEEVSEADADAGIALARRDLKERVLDATYYDLSRGDIRFLEAMLEDGSESRLTDIASRLGEGSNYVSTYKRRLVEQGVIGERGHGTVGFDLPWFEEYLRERL